MTNFATYNVRGLGSYDKRSKIFNFLRNKYYDVIALQETHSVRKCERKLENQKIMEIPVGWPNTICVWRI